jgi:general secretion pathway protein H
MTASAPVPAGAARREREAGVTLIEILVVLVIVGVMASVIGFGAGGNSRSAAGPEREAALLSVRLERAANDALAQGLPAAFIWDAEGYAFASLQAGEWAAHPDGVLATPHKVPNAVELSVSGQPRGTYLIRADLLPSRTVGDDETPAPLTVAFASSRGGWNVVFDGLAAQSIDMGDTGR